MSVVIFQVVNLQLLLGLLVRVFSCIKHNFCLRHLSSIAQSFQVNNVKYFKTRILKGTFHENQMHAKVYIVIPIEKQVLSALRNSVPFLNRTYQRQDMEKNIWTDFNFNTLLFLCFIVGEQRLQIFFIVRQLVVGEY